jgi:hypothetical protein
VVKDCADRTNTPYAREFTQNKKTLFYPFYAFFGWLCHRLSRQYAVLDLQPLLHQPKTGPAQACRLPSEKGVNNARAPARSACLLGTLLKVPLLLFIEVNPK